MVGGNHFLSLLSPLVLTYHHNDATLFFDNADKARHVVRHVNACMQSIQFIQSTNKLEG